MEMKQVENRERMERIVVGQKWHLKSATRYNEQKEYKKSLG